MKGLDVKSFDDLKDVFKLMVGEMLENGIDGELDYELGYKDIKALMADLKRVYAAVDEQTTLSEPDKFDKK